MLLRNCHNFHDFRRLAERRLPSPIFNYIDGAADDEVTHQRNTKAFESCDLVPHVLRGVENVDLSVTVMGQKLSLPVFPDGSDVNAWMVRQGWALASGFVKVYESEQAEAEAAKRGLWDGSFVPPWRWRQSQ